MAHPPDIVWDFLETNGWNLDSYADSDLSDLSGYKTHIRRYECDADDGSLWENYRLPVAFKIARLVQGSRIIELAYLRVNKSNGLQRIVFNAGTDGLNIPPAPWHVPEGMPCASSAEWNTI